MPVTIQDNSAAWFREFDKRCNEALEQIGDAILEQGPAFTPVKTGATLNSEAKNVQPMNSVEPGKGSVEVGAGTEYAPQIMEGTNRNSGEPNPFLIKMLLASKPKIKSALTEKMIENKGIYVPDSPLMKD